jgi:hypothetical protein
MKKSSFVLICVLTLAACSAPMRWEQNSGFLRRDNPCYTVSVEPVRHPENAWGFGSLLVTITNETDSDITIDWNQTYYMRGGASHGRFYRSGFYWMKDLPSEPDIILARGHLYVQLYPSTLIFTVRYGGNMRHLSGYRHDYLPPGENGVRLTAICDGAPVREYLSVLLVK